MLACSSTKVFGHSFPLQYAVQICGILFFIWARSMCLIAKEKSKSKSRKENISRMHQTGSMFITKDPIAIIQE